MTDLIPLTCTEQFYAEKSEIGYVFESKSEADNFVGLLHNLRFISRLGGHALLFAWDCGKSVYYCTLCDCEFVFHSHLKSRILKAVEKAELYNLIVD